MKIPVFAIILIAVMSLAVSCGESGLRVLEETKRTDTLVKFRFESKAIVQGKLEKSPEATLFVSLPDSYRSSRDKRYPVVYALHGFGDGGMSMILTLRGKGSSGADVPEVIVVGIEGGNSLGGSFFANSPATGNWEDLVTNEAISLVDRKFRTVATREGRVLAGYSMGGFGSWRIALSRPDLFCGAWAACPGAWDENGLADTLSGWNSTYRNAYGAAYAPDLSLAPPYARIPKLDGTPADDAIAADWRKGFGSVDERLAAYRTQPFKLKLVSLAYGNRDGYGWIIRGTRFIADRMEKAGVPVEIREYTAGHLVTDAMIRESYVPFLRAVFR
jgi:S-formylglutathione hydrolase FrmB